MLHFHFLSVKKLQLNAHIFLQILQNFSIKWIIISINILMKILSLLIHNVKIKKSEILHKLPLTALFLKAVWNEKELKNPEL